MGGYFDHRIYFQAPINRPPSGLSRVLRKELVGFCRDNNRVERFPMLGNVEIGLTEPRNGRKSPHTYLKPTDDALRPTGTWLTAL